MKFKTKLAITFLTIILLPVLLSLCAFLGIGTIMMRSGGQTTYDEGMRAYSMMSESIDAFSQATDELFDTIQEQARENTHRLEDKAYLDKLNEEAADKSSYIIIRKGDQIYYAGNAAAAQQIFSRLPAMVLKVSASWASSSSPSTGTRPEKSPPPNFFAASEMRRSGVVMRSALCQVERTQHQTSPPAPAPAVELLPVPVQTTAARDRERLRFGSAGWCTGDSRCA